MTYYFPISSSNLHQYMSSALITPACCFGSDNNTQAINAQYLFLLKEKAVVQDTDCILELVLTKEEESELIDCAPGFLLEKSLPISRIKRMSFTNEEKGKTIVGNIILSTAFIPEGIIDYSMNCDEVTCKEYKSKNDTTKSFNQENEEFNRLLGGLALMRIARNPEETFSENYISMIAKYNIYIKQQLCKEGEKLNDKMLNDSDIINDIKRSIDKELLFKIAKEEKQENLLSPFIDLRNLKGKTRVFAFIYDYELDQQTGSHNIDELICKFFNELGLDKEELAFYYGYNKGYQRFSKIHGGVNFKYSLESKLDRYIIETVYQFTVNGKKESSQFLYLDEIYSDLSILELPSSIFDYHILDTLIKKKVDIVEYANKKWGDLCEGFCGGGSPKDIFYGIIKDVGEMVSRFFGKYNMSVRERNDAVRVWHEVKMKNEKLEEENLKLKVKIEELKKNNNVLVAQGMELVKIDNYQDVVLKKETIDLGKDDGKKSEKNHESKLVQKSKLPLNRTNGQLKIAPEVISDSKEGKNMID